MWVSSRDYGYVVWPSLLRLGRDDQPQLLVDHGMGAGNSEILQCTELLSHGLGEAGYMNCIFNDTLNVQ